MRAWTAAAAVLILLLIAACAPRNQLQGGDNASNLQPPPAPPDARPDIPRTTEPVDVVPADSGNAQLNLTRFLNTTLFTRAAPGGIVAGDIEHPFLVGEKLGLVLPLLTRQQLRILASKQPTMRGQPLRSDPYLRFDFGNETSGELRYVRDPDTNLVGSELFFAQEQPMFEYAYLLQDGAFPLLIGEEIDLFGHTYEVHTATNISIQLYGKDVQQFVYLANNSALEVNGTSISDTHVEVDPWHFTIRYFAPVVDEGGIRLKPGEDLRSKLPRPEMLLNPLFDISYDGLEQSPNDTVAFRSVPSGVRMDFFNVLGEPETVQLVNTQNGSLGWGGNHPLHVAECASPSDFCVALDDEFLLTSRSGVSRVFAFGGVGEIGDVLSLRDSATNEQHVVKLVDTGKNVSGSEVYDGTLAIDGSVYDLRVLHNASAGADASRISVDMDANGAIRGDAITVVTHALHEISFPAKNQTNATRLILFASPRLGALAEEDIPVRVSISSGQLLLGLGPANITLNHVKSSQTYQGISTRGVLVTLDHSLDGVSGPQLRLEYPSDYRAGIVRVTG